jgi:hypothetical protein
MPEKNRTWRPVETRLLAEYLALRFRGQHVKERVRLGTSPDELVDEGMDERALRMVGVWRRWADAVVIQPGRCLVIEAAVLPDPGDVSKLQLYCRLWPRTPEYAEYSKLPVTGMLVYAVPDGLIAQLAAEAHLLLDYYHPAWIDDYLAKLAVRARRAPLG